MRGMEEPPLSNSAVFPTFRWTGNRCKTSKRPRFTKTDTAGEVRSTRFTFGVTLSVDTIRRYTTQGEMR
jgi:hypothetical protein